MHKKLDKYDLDILRALERDSALTNARLAELVGLSTSQCSRRRAGLESDGVIVGYHARLDPEAMGRGLRAVVRVNLLLTAKTGQGNSPPSSRGQKKSKRPLPSRAMLTMCC